MRKKEGWDLLKVVKRGTLRFWGDWFGRPYDNFHTVIKSELSKDKCVLYFDGGEICIVTHPIEIVSTANEFHIKYAHQIQWNWNLYGALESDQNKRMLTYERMSDTVVLKNNSISLNPKDFFALEIL